ncbi:hypothetical protein NTGHW29_20026 [Candidatus Nitrotoga sp. HW29]|nr:hypothetical protein NTGHW29_20026 [Candidatus Nitrotoga sp. HW29]
MLWRINAVHHSDVEMDATTSLRRHPLEHVISALVFVPTLIALGPDPFVLLGYNVLPAAVSALNHDNFSLGKSEAAGRTESSCHCCWTKCAWADFS